MAVGFPHGGGSFDDPIEGGIKIAPGSFCEWASFKDGMNPAQVLPLGVLGALAVHSGDRLPDKARFLPHNAAVNDVGSAWLPSAPPNATFNLLWQFN